MTEFNIFRAKEVWSNPDIVRGEMFYEIRDGHSSMLSNIECTSMKDMAETLYTGAGISKNFMPGDTINHRPPRSVETVYIDGYFGRPIVPAAVYKYSPLKRAELKELKEELEKLQRKKRKTT